MNAEPPAKRRVDFDLSAKQKLAFDNLLAYVPNVVWSLLYGGAKGGGKSVFLCLFDYAYALMLADEFGLEPQTDLRRIPIIGFLGRKRSVEFNSTTLVSWKRFIPADHYEMRLLEGKVPVIIIDRRVALLYGGMDNTENVKKFNSAELMFASIDQAEELTEEDIAMVKGALRLQLKDRSGIQRPPARGYKILLSANPRPGWLRRDFVKPITRKPNCSYLQALPSDNPFLPPGYIDTLRQAYGFNPALLAAYLNGNWDDLDEAMVIIPRRRLERCINNKTVNKSKIRRLTVCDVAGESENSDESVIGNFINEELQPGFEFYAHRDLMDTAGRIIAHAVAHNSSCIVIDKVGEGAAVYSRVREVVGEMNAKKPKAAQMVVYGFDGRRLPPDGLLRETYLNWKSMAWFEASKHIIAERRCSIPADEKLVDQLCGVTYHFTSNGKLAVDRKEDLKAAFGCSPDRADMFIMGLDGLKYARVAEVKDRYAEEPRHRNFSPDAV